MDNEIGRLIVRLIGDGSEYQQMLKTAEKSSVQSVAVIEAASKRIEGFANGLRGFATTALGVLAGLGVAASAKEAFKAFADLEQGQIRLSAAVEAGGHAAGPLVERYLAVAKQLQATTLATKGQIMALFRMAEVQGFSGDAAERVVRNSLALANATNTDAQSQLRGVAAMERGNYQYVARSLGIRDVRNQQELQHRVEMQLQAGQRIGLELYNSASGRVERLGRALRLFSAEIGAVIAKAILPLVEWLQKVVEQFKAADPSIKKVVATVLALTVGLLSLGAFKKTLMDMLGPILLVAKAITGPFALAVAVFGVLSFYLGSLEAGWQALTDELGAFGKALQGVWDYLVGFAKENQVLVGILVVLTAAIGAVAIAIHLVSAAYSVLTAVWAFFKATQILQILLWVATKIVLMAALIVIGLLIVAYAAFKVAVWAASVSQAAFAVSAGTSSIAVGLLTAAVSLLGAAFAAVAVIVSAIAFAAVVAIFIAIASAVGAAWAALSMIPTLLRQISTTSGPLAYVGSMFSEWYRILQTVITALKTDMPLAMELLSASFKLAVEQMKALWTPLWAYIQTGFGLLAEALGSIFDLEFQIIRRKIIESLRPGRTSQEALDEWVASLRAGQQSVIEGLGNNFATMNEGFVRRNGRWVRQEMQVQENEAIRGARENVRRLTDRLEHPDTSAAERGGVQIGAALNRGIQHEMHKFDAALFDSAEAVSRIEAYLERIQQSPKDVAERTERNNVANVVGQIGLGSLSSAFSGLQFGTSNVEGSPQQRVPAFNTEYQNNAGQEQSNAGEILDVLKQIRDGLGGRPVIDLRATSAGRA